MRIDPEEPRPDAPKYRSKYQIYHGPKNGQNEYYRKKEEPEESQPAEPVNTRPARKHRKDAVKYVRKEPKKAVTESDSAVTPATSSIPENKEVAKEQSVMSGMEASISKEESNFKGESPVTSYKEEPAAFPVDEPSEGSYSGKRGYGYGSSGRHRRGNNRRGSRGYRAKRQWDRHSNREEEYYQPQPQLEELPQTLPLPMSLSLPQSLSMPQVIAQTQEEAWRSEEAAYSIPLREASGPASESSSPYSKSPKQSGKLNVDAPPFQKLRLSPSSREEAAANAAAYKLERDTYLNTTAKAFIPKMRSAPQPAPAPIQQSYMPYAPGIYQNVVLIPPQPMFMPMQYGNNFYTPPANAGITFV